MKYCASLLSLFAAFTVGCTDTTRDPIGLNVGDEIVLGTEVQPYLGLGCGSLDCHGDQGRALRIYAKFGLRESPDLRTLAVSQSEVAANASALAALADGEPANHLALLKGLATSEGGLAHIGGDIWANTSAPGYQCVLAYLSGSANATACGEALAEVDVEP